MLQVLKDHGPHVAQLAQSMVDAKAAVSAAVSAVGVVAVAVTEPKPVTISIDEWSAYAVIFSCTATALFMLSNLVLNLIKIKRELKENPKCDTK